MEYVRELFKAKDKLVNVAAVFAVGVVLLISGNTLFAGKPEKQTPAQEPLVPEQGFEEKLEERLSGILSRVEGAGNVRVMITLAYGREIVVAEDGKYERTATEETDAQGGTRTVETLNTAGTKIMLKDDNGGISPLVLKTIEPKIEGVIIVAEGGGSAVVREQLITAAQTVLGVEPHKVQVLKSKPK